MAKCGQLEITKMDSFGSGDTKGRNNLGQVTGLTNIEKICAGENFALAMDDLGIVYEWGKGTLTPQVKSGISGEIVDISAGEQDRVFVMAKGMVYGQGSIINGEIPNITDAIKAVVTNNSIVILTIERKNI